MSLPESGVHPEYKGLLPQHWPSLILFSILLMESSEHYATYTGTHPRISGSPSMPPLSARVSQSKARTLSRILTHEIPT